MLQARQLTLWRGERRLFHQLTFRLGRGSMLLLRGPNGSGKTSLLRVLAGLLPAESGTVELNGALLNGDPAEYWRNLAWLGHKDGLKGELSVQRNLDFLMRLAGGGAATGNLLKRAGLDGLRCRSASQLSRGQRRRLALAGLIGTDTALWLLDEPDANLDRQGRAWLSQALESHLSAGGCAVLASHRLDWSVKAPVPQLILGAAQ